MALEPPALILMVGAPGTGKSVLARAIAADVGAEIIQTDAVRKKVFASPRYTSKEDGTVYGICHRRVSSSLGKGRRVVFDATNLREASRAVLYRIAEQRNALLVVVVAYAPEHVIRARLDGRQRRSDPDELSDADWKVYLHLRREAEPVRRPHLVVNTCTSPRPAMQAVRRLVRAMSDVAI